jgi:hypothetical protein
MAAAEHFLIDMNTDELFSGGRLKARA